MNRKFKLAFAALLGFSAACSSVKNAPKETSDQPKDADTTVVDDTPHIPPRVVVMYGVRVPQQDSVRAKRLERVEQPRPDSMPAAKGKPGGDQSPAKK